MKVINLRFHYPHCQEDKLVEVRRVNYVDPSLAEFALVIVSHGDVDTVLVLYLFLHLFETLILEVEAVFQETILQVLRDIIKGDMDKNGSHNGQQYVYPCAPVQVEERRSPMAIKEPHTENHHDDTEGDGINHHLLGIKLQMLLVSRAYTADTDNKEGHHLAMDDVTILIDIHKLDSTMNIHKDTAPIVYHLWVDDIFKELHTQADIDKGTEYHIEFLEVFAFFHLICLLHRSCVFRNDQCFSPACSLSPSGTLYQPFCRLF